MLLIIYRLFCWCYSFGALLISPWNPKARLWRRGRKKIFPRLENRPGGGREGTTVWMHCASLGEFEQGRPVLESIRAQYPGTRIVLSFFSPSGYEIRKNYEGADLVCYLPMDSPANARRFLDSTRPSLVLWVKYEYWYFYLREIKQRNIPLLLVSGIFRDDQPFFKWWGGLHRKMLGFFTQFFVQNDHSAELLAGIGFAANTTRGGDTRFDRVIAVAENFETVPLVESFAGSGPTIVAGSTWTEDDEELDHFANTHPAIKFIIAPHEIDETRLQEMEKLYHRSIRYSSLQGNGYPQPKPKAPGEAPNVLIVDSIGLLTRLYRYATIAYVGGGFGDDGVHNVLEAAVYGKPVVFGPVYEKYAEAVALVDSGGAYPIEQALELEAVLEKLLKNGDDYAKSAEAAKVYVFSGGGATAKLMAYIHEKRLLMSW